MSWKPLPQPKPTAVEEFGRRFRKKARLLVDERAGNSLARALRDFGWNAVAVEEADPLYRWQGCRSRQCGHQMSTRLPASKPNMYG